MITTIVQQQYPNSPAEGWMLFKRLLTVARLRLAGVAPPMEDDALTLGMLTTSWALNVTICVGPAELPSLWSCQDQALLHRNSAGP